MTVVGELAGQPRFSSDASWLRAVARAALSLETAARAASTVAALVGAAVATVWARALLAVVT